VVESPVKLKRIGENNIYYIKVAKLIQLDEGTSAPSACHDSIILQRLK
jgi:hypothetical protein